MGSHTPKIFRGISMSGGETAIRGFDYQATVILDEIMTHFATWGEDGFVRPEGEDDLDLFEGLGPIQNVVHVQIKKPRQSETGELSPSAWTIAEAVSELIPQSIERLRRPFCRQIWILGDKVSPDLTSVIELGQAAPAQAYLTLIHLLGRNETIKFAGLGKTAKKRLQAWRPSPVSGFTIEENIQEMVAAFRLVAERRGLDAIELDVYQRAIDGLQVSLPLLLGRIELKESNGIESEVVDRVNTRLSAQYRLNPTIVKDTLFRNLRGFISDISKQHGRSFGGNEFDYEIGTVWPEMIPIKVPPELETDHINRNDITSALLAPNSKIVEVVGVSGSGKSSLAAEAIKRIEKEGEQNLSYYVEIRKATRFRHVLAGLTFRLRRFGADFAFDSAVDGTSSNERAAIRVARALSDLNRPVSIFLDLVEGGCDSEFSRDLCTFVRQIAKGQASCRVIALGQERTLKEFSEFDREALGVVQVDVRGFEFEEFLRLARARQSSLSRESLWNVFGRVTKGRSTGLVAARARSIADMSQNLAQQILDSASPEEMIGRADVERFERISIAALNAAQKLVCFVLPFSAPEAASAFPNDNVRRAIVEMRDLALLRRYDETSFEMHETVRAGLESYLPLSVGRAAHAELANWYARRQDVPAVVFHLDAADRHSEACAVARDEFLQGRSWSALRDYAVAHQLISKEEAIGLFAYAKENGRSYFLPQFFEGGASPDVADALIELLRTSSPPESSVDFSWTSNLMRAILYSDSDRLLQLLEYSLEVPETDASWDQRFGYLQMAISQANIPFSQGCVNLFNRESPDAKRRMLPIFVASGNRDVMRVAFGFLEKNPGLLMRDRGPSHSIRLHVVELARTREFLAALPSRDSSQMLVRRSALLEPLLGLIWAQRHALRKFCIQLLRDSDPEPAVMQGAARVLVALGEPSLLKLCDGAKTFDQSTRTFFEFLPVLVPWLVNRAEYEKKILDTTVEVKDRISAVLPILALGSDIGVLLEKLKLSDPTNADLWEFLILHWSVFRPFSAGISAVARKIKLGDKNITLGPLVASFGRLGGTDARRLLLEALDHSDPNVRVAAITTLAQVRDRHALYDLVARLAVETDVAMAQGLVVAIASSHPDAEVMKQIDWSRVPSARIWRSIMAGRLRDVREAGEIADVATDMSQRWQVRRAAVLAAGRLAEQPTLEKIRGSLSKERSPFDGDKTYNLEGHELALNLLSNGLPFLFEEFLDEKAQFVDFVAKQFNDTLPHAVLQGQLSPGQEVATWMYEQLIAHNYPSSKAGVDAFIDRLQIPIVQAALLRSLRMAGRYDLIEEEASTAYSAWYLMRCVLELRHNQRNDPPLRERVGAIIAASPWRSNGLMQNLVPDTFGIVVSQPLAGQATTSTTTPEVVRRKFVEVTVREIEAALDGSIKLDDSLPLRLFFESEDRYKELIRDLDPENDYVRDSTRKPAFLRFTTSGYLVNDGQHNRKENRANLRASLRPAIAAANRWDLPIPWHSRMLEEDRFDAYAGKFVDCLAACGDLTVFYREMARYEGILMPSILSSKIRAENIQPVVNESMVPFLTRYLGSGHDAFLVGLCTVAGHIRSSAVDDVLEGLLARWHGRFNLAEPSAQHNENIDFWVAFHRLSRHPRFDNIRDWDIRLEEILRGLMDGHQRDDVLKTLCRSSRMYRTIETQLFRRWTLTHYRNDIVDILENEADRLFRT
ncbi:HEAT repeat domain-containing protein [Cupriavidus sp. PET2-C1]